MPTGEGVSTILAACTELTAGEVVAGGGHVAAIGPFMAEAEDVGTEVRGAALRGAVKGGKDISLAIVGRVVHEHAGAKASAAWNDHTDTHHGIALIGPVVAFATGHIHFAVIALCLQDMAVGVCDTHQVQTAFAPYCCGFEVLDRAGFAEDHAGAERSILLHVRARVPAKQLCARIVIHMHLGTQG